ncbi:hypothetical protein [Pseudooceanicola nitratireducens]|uniref:Uncharacterized protein n=1 Tax=Pseudooceanicola nitratireducens TaxID=517719 RepID=A0A1I1P5H2_9RHOB|nr:hypothetical protein [Pseudooceanicola nitratireducens]MEC7792892.1 hypothetical protein [Pseudomonadota bacterium]MBY6156024.1 hypothetical protein [Pseudooceanicola nitratireducens]MBY6167175.1 hypothetical protein [Pseudooceanicola nitratireducens]MEC8668620.1 hypothetical protein [Pseudomonadota bacterium]SEI62725.1 hypothetical protein SAMN05216183_10191 [Pseudooceanicola nitratireducens]
MIVRLTGAFLRALLIALAIATPALLLPNIGVDAAQVTVLVALVAGAFTFVEYYSQYPSILEFRFAPPVNRLRYFTMFSMVLLLTVYFSGAALETPIASLLMKLAELMARAVDFPFSPVRLVLLALPPETTEQTVAMVRAAAGIAYVVGILGVIAFGVLVRIYGWPVRYGAFNVWINLPLFDPTGGGDVLTRLKRDAVLNLVLGFLLPFLLPAFVKLAGALIDINIGEAHTLVWVMTIWAFVPANLMIRGIALYRVADIIEEKRRRTYAEARSDDGMQIA